MPFDFDELLPDELLLLSPWPSRSRTTAATSALLLGAGGTAAPAWLLDAFFLEDDLPAASALLFLEEDLALDFLADDFFELELFDAAFLEEDLARLDDRLFVLLDVFFEEVRLLVLFLLRAFFDDVFFFVDFLAEAFVEEDCFAAAFFVELLALVAIFKTPIQLLEKLVLGGAA